MKRLISMFVVLALAGIAFAANESYLADTGTVNLTPAGKVYKLHTSNTVWAKDSFATTVRYTYGPYDLTNREGGVCFQGFTVYQMDAITGTTPTVSLDYQIIGGTSIEDTISSWTACDTLDGTAHSQYVDFTSENGKAIVFRIHNYDGTSSQIPGDLWIMMKPNETWNTMR